MMSLATNHIIGVDGGGSTCRVAIATTDGTVIGGASGAPANPATSMHQAVACLHETLEAARIDAGLTTEQMTRSAIHLGLAGVASTEIADMVAAAIAMKHIVVTDDRATNMVGALGNRDGFIAALGTGSFFGCQQEGSQRFVGGWGLWLADQASGAWLGRTLLSSVLEWRDGFHPTSPLLEETFADYGEDPSRIIFFAMEASPHAYGKLAPRIIEAAKLGDSAGLAIMRAGAKHVQRALNALEFNPGDALCLTGGIGPHMALYLDDRFTANLIEPSGGALDGALRMAASVLVGETA